MNRGFFRHEVIRRGPELPEKDGKASRYSMYPLGQPCCVDGKDRKYPGRMGEVVVVDDEPGDEVK